MLLEGHSKLLVGGFFPFVRFFVKMTPHYFNKLEIRALGTPIRD